MDQELVKTLKNHLFELRKYIKKELNIPIEKTKVVLKHDKQNANNIYGKTAYYDPQNKTIALYITNRHPKDILRSFCHEVIHVLQDYRGEFSKTITTEEGYAQKNGFLREIEKEAYLKGCMLFRDYEDKIKGGK